MALEYLQALVGGTIEESSPAYSGIMVIAEPRGKRLGAATSAVLGRARELADRLGARVATVIAGADARALAGDAIAAGSDVVIVADSPALAGRPVDLLTRCLTDIIEDRKPEIVLLAATEHGRDLAARLAARLRTGLLSDCRAIDLDEGERLLLGTRAVYGGLMLETLSCPICRPQIASVLPGWLRPPPPDAARQGVVEEATAPDDGVESALHTAAARLPRRPQPLHEARVIVAGGRGLGGPAGFAVLGELAALLGGVVAASRSAVELGWAPPEQLVDITGAHVHPDLYVAVALSGALPHRIALHGTRCLVAINRDPQAPIMRAADIGVAGDWRQVVPRLIRSLKEARAA